MPKKNISDFLYKPIITLSDLGGMDEIITEIKETIEYPLKYNNIHKHMNIQPVKGIVGNRLNLDLANLMAGAVTEAMFRKIAEREQLIRTQEAARATPLLQKVFSRTWE